METKEAVVVSYVRTAFTRAHKGLFKDTRPDTLGAAVIKAAVEKVPGLEKDQIDDVIMGCAMPEGEQGMNVARISTLMAGLPDSTPAMTVNRFCSSGLQTISIAAERVMVGQNDIVIAGGTESMTMVPMTGNKFSANITAMKEMPEVYTPMGATAENVAKKFDIARETQDAFALASHEKALKAWEEGFLAGEVIDIHTRVSDSNGEWKDVVVNKDDGPRAGSTIEGLGKLRTVFDPVNGSVTAGNASPLTDGAAAVVIMSKEKADELGLKPLGYYRAFQVAGVPPELMGIGPVPAIRKLLEKTGLTVDDIDLFEINEAFASQASYCGKELGVPVEKLNIHGGAIALGHPLGVSGTRMTGTLLRSLEKVDGRYGIVSMCIGGGMGAAALFERVK